jgi:uncharacterized membrane protein
MGQFLLGAVAMASLVAATFFLRFWLKTHDRFFLLFAAAFLLEAINRLTLAAVGTVSEEHEPLFYLVRLFSFVLILIAIVDKNLRGGRRK